jgi:GTPase SAR1 family protein
VTNFIIYNTIIMPAVDLWQLLKSAAAAEANRPRGDQEQGSEDGVETTVVVLGTKSAGKTTIINTFLDKGM